MVADNDAGGISIYAQAGQEHGLWIVGLLVVLAPVLFVNQEMVARLGAVTGAGHARLIFERFGRRWGFFALTDLLILNLLTIITEFIGVALAMGFFGVSRYVSVPIAALALAVVTGVGSFRRWERAMYALVAVSLIVIPLAVLSQAHHDASNPTVATTPSSAIGGGIVLLIVAMIGTTVAPWQLFFQQSNVVDKRITARWLRYERVDLAIGTTLFTIGAVAVIVTCAVALGGLSGHEVFVDAGHVAADLKTHVGVWAGVFFALVLLNGSVLGAGAVTLATSYALGDVFGVKHSLHRRWSDAPIFHGSFVTCLAIAAGVVLIPGSPLGIVTVGVQVLAGILLPSATVFLVLLCNDRAVLGPWANPRWLNVVAVLVVGILIELSALLTLSTLFRGLNMSLAAASLTGVLIAALAGVLLTRARQETIPTFSGTPWERATWTMQQVETLPPPPRSRARTVGLVVLRCYLVIASALVIVRVVQAILGG